MNRLSDYFSISSGLHDLGSTLLSLRALHGLGTGAACFPVYRAARFVARGNLEDILDRFALGSGWAAHRPDSTSLLLDGEGLFVRVAGQSKTDYVSGSLTLWTDSVERAEGARERLLGLIEDARLEQQTFTIDWHFTSAHQGLTSVSFEELADPALLDEAYPSLGEPVSVFVERYLAARETVLILQGPPGTGKTRLVRAILAALSRRKDTSAKVLYTADRRTLEQDEVYVDFLTGSHDAFVVEDADHMLGARSNGNVDLHRFLAVADGIVRAQGRKIIFTTNLANVGDIDDALMRPGRCFGVVRARALSREEAGRLVVRILATDAAGADAVIARAMSQDQKAVTLAALYQVIEQAHTGVIRASDAMGVGTRSGS